MIEHPENAPTKPKPPLWKIVRQWTIIGGIYAIILGMAGWGVRLIWLALRTGTPMDTRMGYLIAATALLFPAFGIGRYFLQQKQKTGRWTTTAAERLQQRNERLAQCAINRHVRPSYNPWSWLLDTADWSTCAAFEAAQPVWRRAVAWIVLSLYVVGLFLIFCLPLIAVGAAFAEDNTHSQMICFFVLAAVLLLVPFFMVRTALRRYRQTGSLRIARAELDLRSAQREELSNKARQRPLRSKLITIVIGVIVLMWWWLRVTRYHAHHSHDPHHAWTLPAFYTAWLLYAVWDEFRKPKTVHPQDYTA